MHSVPGTYKISKIPNHYCMRKRAVTEKVTSPIALICYHHPDPLLLGAPAAVALWRTSPGIGRSQHKWFGESVNKVYIFLSIFK